MFCDMSLMLTRLMIHHILEWQAVTTQKPSSTPFFNDHSTKDIQWGRMCHTNHLTTTQSCLTQVISWPATSDSLQDHTRSSSHLSTTQHSSQHHKSALIDCRWDNFREKHLRGEEACDRKKVEKGYNNPYEQSARIRRRIRRQITNQ